jgi:predicted transcriptional regulator
MLEDGSAKAQRVGSGLSLRDVADALGVDKATVYRWEVGKRIPHREAALRYADLLDALAEQVSA